MIASMRILALCAGLAICGATAGCNSDDKASAKSGAETAADDAKLWQGNWRLISATRNGESETRDAGWRVSGDRYEVTLNGNAMEHWQFTLDPAAKHFIALATSGANGTHQEYLTSTGNSDRGTCCGRIRGSYEIGQDTLRVAFDPSFQEYPKSFDAGRGSRFTTFVFKRQ